MNKTVVELDALKWTDYLDPDKQTLEKIASELSLENRVLYNCLDTDYLPHIETYPSAQFLILRLMEPQSKPNANSVQELTTKVAIFFNSDQIITIHRLPLREIFEVAKKIQESTTQNKESTTEKLTKSKIISFFYEQVSLGFDKPLTELEFKLHTLEENLFSKSKPKTFLQEGFYLKRKASAFKKVLKLTIELLGKLIVQADCQQEQFVQSRDRLERSLFYAEDVYDNIQSLLNLHMSIESQKTNEASFRTNEIMRVLTVLTIFFLPLNFIAGVFGMNFQYIPLLTDPEGFIISMVIMLVISLLLGVYLLKQGWLVSAKKKVGSLDM